MGSLTADFPEIVDSMHEVEIDLEGDQYQCTFDTNSASFAIVAVVARAKDCEPTELTPLYSEIDPDAIDSIFSDRGNDKQRNGHLSFHYEGFTISVFSEGVIEATPIENAVPE